MAKSDDSSYFPFRGDRSNNGDKTSTTFLARLRGHETGAWMDFTEIYVPLIKFWCRKRKDVLSHAERQDVLQEVQQSVFSSIERFDRTREERSFRGWLRRITKNRICDHLREKARDETVVKLFGDPDRLDVSMPELDDEIDPEEEVDEQRVLLRQVLKRIRPEFREKSWDVFHLLFDAEKDSSEVAEMFDMTVVAVRKLRSRILKRIREEYAKLGIE